MLNDLIRSEVGDVRGKSLVHLLCHIGTDTLSWALLGATVTGIDISPRSLHYARLLAARMGIDADFIESDIMDVIEQIEAIHPGHIRVYVSSDSSCPEKGMLVIEYASHDDREQIEALIGETFFGIPWKGLNV